MKKLLYLLLLPLAFACDLTPPTESKFGQEQTFIKVYGGGSNHVGASAMPTEDGGFIFAGNTQVEGNIILQNYTGKMFLVKTDALGNELWNLTPDTTNQSISTDIAIDADGNYVMIGMRLNEINAINTDFDVRVVKISPAGETLWIKDFGNISGTTADYATDITIASNGDYLLIGHTTSDLGSNLLNASAADLYALRISSDGDLVWQKVYGRAAPNSDVGVGIAEESNGDIVWFGHVEVSQSGKQMRLVRSNSEGNVIWDFTYPLSSNSQTAGSLLSTNSGYVLMGTINGQYTVLETNKSGQLIWSNTVSELDGTSIALPGGGLAYSSDGQLLITGTFQSSSSSSEDILLLKLNNRGEYIWHRRFGAGDLDIGKSVSISPDGGIIISGTLGFESNGLMGLIKTDIDGKVSD